MPLSHVSSKFKVELNPSELANSSGQIQMMLGDKPLHEKLAVQALSFQDFPG